MRRWRKSLSIPVLTWTVLAWVAGSSVRAQGPPPPMAFPPSAPPGYFSAPPGGYPGGYPMPPNNGLPVPRGYPIPGRDDPTELARKQGSKNPLEMVLEGDNAFADTEACNCDAGGYAMVGLMALMRNPLGNSVVAVSDPRNPAIDQSTLPPSDSTPALNTNDLMPSFNFGFRGAIGYRQDVHGVEFFGWYVPGNSSSETVADPGRLAVGFAAFPIPNGLGIDNRLWLNADVVRISLLNKMYNLEGNYRYGCGTGVEFLCGLRYLNIFEQFEIFADDNGLTVDPPDPRAMATYRSQTQSRIVGPQFGVECENRPSEWLSVGIFSKLFAGPNFYSTRITLVRGDDFVALDNARSQTTVSGAVELGGYLDFLILARMRLRLGYQMMWVLNVPEAHSQVEYNIAEFPYGSGKDQGEMLFHGPLLEFHFAF